MHLLIYIDIALFIFIAFFIGYDLFFTLASFFRRRHRKHRSIRLQKFAVIFAAYKEDQVIQESVERILLQDYPADKYRVIVVSDHMREETNQALAKLPIELLTPDFEHSMKHKSITYALEYLKEGIDKVVILDADNLTDTDFLTRINDITQDNEQSLHTKEVRITDTSFSKLSDPDQINWFEVSGLTNADAITRIVKDFGLHNLDAKDILTPQHVVKVEEYKGRMLIVLNSCYYDVNNEMRSEHISILVANNTVITFTESNNPVFEAAHKALLSNMLNIRKKGSGLLLAFLLNTIIANLVESASKVEEILEDIEETLLDPKNDQGNMGSLIQQHRHEYMIIRKNSLPLKDQFSKLLRTENGIITPDILPIYNDLQDQLQFVIQTTESCREITSSLVDLYISNNDLRMNAIMKRLTIVSTLFIPLTFLVGVWGMNFKIMPELDWRYGYFIAWAVMIATGVLTWLYMKRKDWY